MKKPEDFVKVLQITLPLLVLFYISLGFFGYLAFGSNIKIIILFNFSMDDVIFVFV